MHYCTKKLSDIGNTIAKYLQDSNFTGAAPTVYSYFLSNYCIGIKWTALGRQWLTYNMKMRFAHFVEWNIK